MIVVPYSFSILSFCSLFKTSYILSYIFYMRTIALVSQQGKVTPTHNEVNSISEERARNETNVDDRVCG